MDQVDFKGHKRKFSELPDNISICSDCGERVTDNRPNDKCTHWDKDGDPYCISCYADLPQNQKVPKWYYDNGRIKE